MANKIGADLSNLDHQWNYVTGLPDPNNLDTDRGLQVKNKGAIWVNAQGERFVSEYNSARNNFPALMIQIPPTYWAIFDEKSKYNLFVSGSGWSDFKRIQEIILDNQNLVKTSSTIEGLATLTTLPIKLLTDTVQHYNEMVDKKVDKDFNRFDLNLSYQPHKITQPPFYAIQFFPMTRKSMGGVVIDNSCHVLDQKQHRIPGLYAVGELTGVAGINGKAALEGTFLGPSIVTGRIAARSALSELNIKLESTIESNMTTNISKAVTAKAKNLDCMNCHDFTLRRMGYWHFEKSHAVVQERQYQCLLCHAKSNSHTKEEHKINPLAQIENCTICH
jgi:succinate dehydrogenase/fumarate reductase flavoprotein subunit